MRVKQIIFIALFIILLLLIPFFIKDKKVEWDEIKEVIKPYIDQQVVQNVDSSTIYNHYKINTNLLDGYISYGPISYMDVQEITIFKEKKDRAKR